MSLDTPHQIVHNKLGIMTFSVYVDASARDAGSAAELAALRKIDKYSALEKTHFFQPIAVESLGPVNIAAYSFLAELGRKISDVSGDDRESSYLFQRISVLIQRYNAILLHESFTDENRPDHWPLQSSPSFFNFCRTL